nr:reverse transcriptase domain-containing protein [Tanacetum cinerariifolium]
MYIDGGSSMEILYEHCFNRLRPDIKKQMVPATTSLTGFSGETTWPLGQLKLLVTIGDATHSTKAWMNFMIVKSMSPYNGIIRRPGLKAIQAVPSTVHRMLKFPTEEGIVTIRNSLLISAECALVNTSSVTGQQPLAVWSIAADYLVSNRYPGVQWVCHIGPWPNVRTVYGSCRDPLLDKCPGWVVILYVISIKGSLSIRKYF